MATHSQGPAAFGLAAAVRYAEVPGASQAPASLYQ